MIGKGRGGKLPHLKAPILLFSIHSLLTPHHKQHHKHNALSVKNMTYSTTPTLTTHYTCTHAHTTPHHQHTYVHTHLRTPTHTHTHTQPPTHPHPHPPTHTHTHTHTHSLTHTFIHTHTHTHTLRHNTCSAHITASCIAAVSAARLLHTAQTVAQELWLPLHFRAGDHLEQMGGGTYHSQCQERRWYKRCV